MEIWQNLEEKRVTDHDFPPPFLKCGVGKYQVRLSEKQINIRNENSDVCSRAWNLVENNLMPQAILSSLTKSI